MVLIMDYNFAQMRKELKQLNESIEAIQSRVESLHYALGHRTELTPNDIDDLEYIIYDLYTFPTITMNRYEYNGNNEVLNCNFRTLAKIHQEIKGHE